jgi:prevent-host-death family protein
VSAPPGITVGAHVFRNRFGYFMERAAAGENINVTRRGRPYVRMTGAQS